MISCVLILEYLVNTCNFGLLKTRPGKKHDEIFGLIKLAECLSDQIMSSVYE